MESKKEKKEKLQESEDEVIEEIESDEDSQDKTYFNEKMQSRFYRKDFPEEGDLVIVSLYSLSRLLRGWLTDMYRLKSLRCMRTEHTLSCLSTRTWRDLFFRLRSPTRESNSSTSFSKLAK